MRANLKPSKPLIYKCSFIWGPWAANPDGERDCTFSIHYDTWHAAMEDAIEWHLAEAQRIAIDVEARKREGDDDNIF